MKKKSTKIILIAFLILVVLSVLIILRPEENFPENLSNQKEYIYDYLKNKGSSKELVYLGYNKPEAEELKNKKEKTDLTQKYPEYIKGIFDPGHEANTLNLKYFSDELIDLGVNTYFVIGEYQINNNQAELFTPNIPKKGKPSKLSDEEGKMVLADRILMAKEKDFSVILVPDYPDAFSVGRENYDISKINPELKRVALEMAELAQEYKVEYLAPVNEYEHLLYSNGYSLDEIKEYFNNFYNNLIPEIREIYDGRIIIKCGNLGKWENFSRLSFEKADMFGVGNAYAAQKGEVAEDIKEMCQASDEISARDNLPWFISEFLVFNPEGQKEMFGKVQSTITTDEAYQEGTQSFLKYGQKASGFTFMGWLGTGKIRSTKAVNYLKNLFINK